MERYNNFDCKIENKEIKKILEKYITLNDVILDIGCGTGLFLKLNIPYKYYYGIDKEKNNVLYCYEKYITDYDKTFIECKIEDFIKNRKVENNVILFLFSLDYIKISTIERLLKEKKYFIAIHYNKPYLSKNSIYYNTKKRFILYNTINKFRIKKLFKKYNVKTKKLLNDDYYYVSVKEANK